MTTTPAQYDVLFYPRSSKSHKNKIKGKRDGLLVVDPSTQRIVLSEDSEVISSKMLELGSKAFAIDETLMVGTWEIEILSCVSGGKPSTALAPPRPALISQKVVRKPGLVSKSISVGGLQSRKRPLGAIGVGGLAQKKKLLSIAGQSGSENGNGNDNENTNINSYNNNSNSNNNNINNVSRLTSKQPSSQLGRKFVVPMKLTSKKSAPKNSDPPNQQSSDRSKFGRGALTASIIQPSVDPEHAPFLHLQLTNNLLRTLRPHQLSGVSFLMNCFHGENQKNASADPSDAPWDDSSDDDFSDGVAKGAILADEMGLGKTIMTISCIYSLFKNSTTQSQKMSPSLKFVVVTPASLVKNWVKEFDKWLGRASQPKRTAITSAKKNEDNQSAIRSFCQSKQSEVLIISYEQLRLLSKNVSIGELVKIRLLVCDEGHRLKGNSGNQTIESLVRLPSESRLIISGSVHQNDLSEFFNLLNFVNPGVFGEIASFRSKFSKPIEQANSKKSTREQRQRAQECKSELERSVSSFMLRRTNADINCLLPPRYECAVFCKPSDHQCELYNQLTTGYDGVDSLSLLTKLRKLCSHPKLIVAAEPAAEPTKFVQASAFVEESPPAPNAVAADKIKSDSDSGKIEVVEELLRNIRGATDEKCVVVSNYTNALNVVQEIAKKRKWGFVRLDGTTPVNSRQGIVDTFNRTPADSKFLFLLSSKAGGVGLNLVGASRLIMLDADWNPATDAQAMGRIYRTGQKLPCFIYRLFLAGTVEEVILQRQLQKGNLSLDVGGGSGSGIASEFSKEELKDCFTLKPNAVCETNEKLGGNWASGEIPVEMVDKDQPFAQLCAERKDLITFVRYGEDRDVRSDSLGSDEGEAGNEEKVGVVKKPKKRKRIKEVEVEVEVEEDEFCSADEEEEEEDGDFDLDFDEEGEFDEDSGVDEEEF